MSTTTVEPLAPGRTRRKTRARAALALTAVAAIALPAGVARADEHASMVATQTNLVANRDGFGALTVDPNLVNAWGMSKFPTSPVWTSNNGTDTSTLYSGGAATPPTPVTVRPLVVSVPGGPTGQIANATPGFTLTNGKPALFVFVSEDGHMYAWNQGEGTTAISKAAVDGAVYKGLAQGSVMGANYLYAADFSLGRIDVFNDQWNMVDWSHAFKVRHLPKGFSPFNVQALTNPSGVTHLFVAYALHVAGQNDEVAGPGLGLVVEFTTDGHMVRRFERKSLNAPWGLAYAPASWGRMAGDLLVGQFGNGRVEVFNPRNGEHEDSLRGANGHALVIEGLWGLMAGDATAGGKYAVLFTAGPSDEADGLYGLITVSPRMEDRH